MGSQGLFCWDVKGKLLWSKDLGVLDGGYVGKPMYQWGHGGSPIFHANLVIVQVDRFKDSYLAAYRAKDGKEVWRRPRRELPTWCTPVVSGGPHPELIANGGAFVRAYDPATGAELWRFADHAEVKVPSPFVVGDVAYFAGGAPRGRHLFALRTGARGEVSFRPDSPNRKHAVFRIPAGGPYTVTPVVHRGLLFTCTDGGTLGCYDAKTGEKRYRKRLGAEFSASPVAAAGRVYLASHDGEIFVIDAGPIFKILARNDLGEPCMATPAIAGDRLYVRTTSALYAFGRR